MSKEVTINAPAQKDGKLCYMQISGHVAHLYVGNTRHKFLIQKTATNDRLLTDYASGLRVGNLMPIKLRASRNYKRMTDRAAAEELLRGLVEKHGQAVVLKKLDSAPAIN